MTEFRLIDGVSRDYSIQPDAVSRRSDGVPVGFQTSREKRKIETILEAKMVLSVDKLACLYRTGTRVFIVAACGTGDFDAKEWDA